jgi:uncharacterized membrane protein YhhN
VRPSTLLFLGAVAISAAFALAALRRDDHSGFAFFKPLTTFIVLVGAAGLVRPAAPSYRGLVVLGLALSLGGDVLLLPRHERFRAALIAFLLAHLAYLAAFGLANPVAPRELPLLVPWLAAGSAVAAAVWRGLGRMRIPVLGYVAVIATMAWRAGTRLDAPGIPRTSALLGLGGALAFMASDAILALRRFRAPIRGAHEVELGLYWMAQTLIALSVRS